MLLSRKATRLQKDRMVERRALLKETRRDEARATLKGSLIRARVRTLRAKAREEREEEAPRQAPMPMPDMQMALAGAHMRARRKLRSLRGSWGS